MIVGKRIYLRAVEEKDLIKIVDWRNFNPANSPDLTSKALLQPTGQVWQWEAPALACLL